MANPTRKAIPASEKEKLNYRIANPENKINKESVNSEEENIEKNVSFYVPLLKSDKEEMTVCGVVLQPEVVDAQGDIISTDVIRKAAHKFLTAFNKATKLGFMHKNFNKNFELLESYVAPQSLVINNKVIKEGSWLMVVKVVDSKVWDLVKSGKITGFSIGGKAKVKNVIE